MTQKHDPVTNQANWSLTQTLHMVTQANPSAQSAKQFIPHSHSSKLHYVVTQTKPATVTQAKLTQSHYIITRVNPTSKSLKEISLHSQASHATWLPKQILQQSHKQILPHSPSSKTMQRTTPPRPTAHVPSTAHYKGTQARPASWSLL